MNELTNIDARVQAHEEASKSQSLVDLAREELQVAGRASSPDHAEHLQNQQAESFRHWAGGTIPRDEEQRTILASNGRLLNVDPPAQTRGTDTAGGHLVPELLGTKIMEKMAETSSMLRMVPPQMVPTGNTVSWPNADYSSKKATRRLEGAAAAEVTLAFGNIDVEFDNVNSGVYSLSTELLQDSAFDLEAFFARVIGSSFGLGLEGMFTEANAVPADKIKGFLSSVTAGITLADGKTVANSTNTDLVDALIDVQHNTARVFRSGASWMFQDAVEASLRKAKDADKRPLFEPRQMGYDGRGIDGLLLGRPYTVNESMPADAVDAHVAAYGNYAEFYGIFQARAMTMHRWASEYQFASRGQVGFMGEGRWAGKMLVPAAFDAIKTLVNGASG